MVFSTIDPWSYWYYSDVLSEVKPAGEFEKAFYFGPAAYAAAIHGTPLLLVDNHPELSSAVMWHREFWNKNANGFKMPSVAQMFLTGTKVYEFLREIGLDKEGPEGLGIFDHCIRVIRPGYADQVKIPGRFQCLLRR